MSSFPTEKSIALTMGEQPNATRVVMLEDLKSPKTLSETDIEDFRRRFSTLFLDEGRRRQGGIGKVYHASNSWGEQFALKVLDASNGSSSQNDEAPESPDIDHYLQEAFEQEYETHRLSASMKGFPRLYAQGQWDGTPTIIMEWVEGETLSKAKVGLAVDDQGRVSPLIAAKIGIALFDLLARMELLNEGLVHRDISPSNVMVCTAGAPIEEQLETGDIELRLIDFGSAALIARDSSITEKFSAPRGATPDFAAPEMLTEDVPDVAALRKSPSIDVYAAGSVLYWMLAGHAPFNLRKTASDGSRLSPYRIKTETAPSPLEMAHNPEADLESLLLVDPRTVAVAQEAMTQAESARTKSEMLAALDRVDGQLAEIVQACLNANQDARPSAKAVRDALEAFLGNYSENLKRALADKGLLPVSARSLAPEHVQVRPKRPKGQIIGQLVAAAVELGVICTCALMLNGIPVSLDMFGFPLQGSANWAVIAGSLLLPAAFGALLRWNGVRDSAGLARATMGVVAGLVLCLMAWLATTFPIPALGNLYLGASIASAACSWLFYVLDFAFANNRKGRQ